ncbi:MAG: nucleotidyl transferase AbiEii/AbiGii toxin family protein [Myxococcales bacterium]|nr:nucleotidyl transferase AbiEii/AbiGii toxin family protein [Myxococcales bacterium]
MMGTLCGAGALALGLIAAGCAEDAASSEPPPVADAATPDQGVLLDATVHDMAVAPDVAIADEALLDAAADAAADAAPLDAAIVDAAAVDAALPAVDPLTVPLGPSNGFGPAARVSLLDIPETPEEARHAGCLVHGALAGSGPHNLLLLAGGSLVDQVRANRQGRVEMVLLLRARGWAEGATAAELETVDLDFLGGDQDPALAFLARRSGFVDGDPAAPGVVSFAETFVDRGWLDSDLIDFSLPVSFLNSPPVLLRLESTRITGQIAAEAPGFRLVEGTIAGYLTTATATIMVEDVKALCAEDPPPAICALIGGQIDRPTEELVGLIMGIVGGADVHFADGRPGPCDPEVEGDCNAMAACFVFEAEPAVISGVSE